jgi:polysaccharide export outer membrane protein
LVIACSLVAGCGTGTKLGPDSTAIKVASALPPPDSPVVVPDIAPYHVLPGDQLTVSVFGASDLDRTGVVDAAGDFSMPLAGTLHVAGKTPDEIIEDVQAKLRGGYLKNPQVAVNVKEASAQQVVTIDGEVQQPGIYPVSSHMTLQQAIATAKGATDTANIRDVIIFRTSDNQKMAAMFNLKAIRSGRQPDPEIYGNDIIVVGESAIQKALRNAAYLAPFLGRFVPVL